MKLRFLALAVAAIAALTPVRAEEPADTSSQCDVPAYLLTSESSLAKVAAVVKGPKRLSIVVVGTRSSSLPGADGEAAAYPARLQAILRERLAGVSVELSTSLLPRKTSEEVAAGFEKLVTERKPDLVVWQTGTVDAIRATDPEEFRSALDDGIAILQKAGIDVVLVNLQYSPRTDMVMAVTPYIDSMRVVAQKMDVPLFDRFAIMRDWHETGDFDLFATPQGSDHGLTMAKRVHECLGQLMAKFVIESAHINPDELKVQR
jgi:hypothetical protein